MAGYRRIISVVDPALGSASATIQRATLLATAFKARHAVLGAADQPPASDMSFRAKASIIAAATQEIERLATRAGARGAEIMAGPRELTVLSALTLTWQPDLIVLAADAFPGLMAALEALRGPGGGPGFDLLSVETERPGLGQRLASAMASML